MYIWKALKISHGRHVHHIAVSDDKNIYSYFNSYFFLSCGDTNDHMKEIYYFDYYCELLD